MFKLKNVGSHLICLQITDKIGLFWTILSFSQNRNIIRKVDHLPVFEGFNLTLERRAFEIKDV